MASRPGNGPRHTAAPPVGCVVLCGGQSSRMGLPKALLPFGPETMLQRVVRLLREVARPIVVVRAPHQELPPLPAELLVTEDQQSQRGPLEGMLAGLTAIAPFAEAAFVTSCDVPLLVPAFVRRIIERLNDHEIAIPRDETRHHPLAAVYCTSLRGRIRGLLQADRLRPVHLLDLARYCEIPVAELRDVDPELVSLRNINHPEEYLAALTASGFEAPPEVREPLRRHN